jgi:hypothetical protein
MRPTTTNVPASEARGETLVADILPLLHLLLVSTVVKSVSSADDTAVDQEVSLPVLMLGTQLRLCCFSEPQVAATDPWDLPADPEDLYLRHSFLPHPPRQNLVDGSTLVVGARAAGEGGP